MLRYSLLVIAFLIGWVAHAQDLDSLKKVAKGLSLEEEAGYYKHLGIIYYKRAEYDSSRKYFDLAISTIGDNDHYQLLGEAYNGLGIINNRLGDYKEAVLSYLASLDNFEKIGNEVSTVQGLTNIGIAYKRMNKYETSLEYLHKSAEVLKKLNLKIQLSTCYNTIGNIYKELGAMELSSKYLKESLLLSEELDNKKGIARSYQNLGIWHLIRKEYLEAKELFFKSLSIKKEFDNEHSQASTLAKIGEVYFELDSIDQALNYFRKSLKIREDNKDFEGIATSSNHLARVYLKKDEPKLAFEFLNKAKKNANVGSYLQEQVTTLSLLRQFHTMMGNYELALEASDEMIEVNREILNKEMANAIAESEINFVTSLKDQEIALQQSELDSLSRTKRLLTAIVFVLIILAVVTIILFHESKKVSRERKIAKERVERLLRELNHRTKNHLQAQSGLIKSQMLKLKDQTTKAVIKDIDNQIKSINLIHQSLYSSTENSPEDINLTSYVENIVENLMISFGMTRNQINLEFDLQEIDLDIHKALPVGLILNESVTNIFKHAFIDQKDKQLFIALEKYDDKSIRLKIGDNGKGFERDQKEKEYGGLQIMRNLAKELDGKLELTHDEGTTVLLEF